MFLIEVLASSASVFACFTSSFLLSAVSGGIEMRITLPSLEGLRPKSAVRIAFSISTISDLSNGCMITERASGTEIVAT